MNSMRDGIPLAILLTVMNVCVTLAFGPQLWKAWKGIPWARVGILLLAGGAISTLMNVWSLILGASPPTPPQDTSRELISAVTEGSDV